MAPANDDIPKWNDIPIAGPRGLFEQMPENIPHFYDLILTDPRWPDLGLLQVVAVGYYSDGTIPNDPPVEYQSPLYHRQKPLPVPPDTEHVPVVVIRDNVVVTAGWAAPGTRWIRPLGPGQGGVWMEAVEWTWVNADGTMGAAPAAPEKPQLMAFVGQLFAASDALRGYINGTLNQPAPAAAGARPGPPEEGGKQ